MIIHHQDGSKAIIESLVKVVRTKQNRIVMCFKSPSSGGKGIVEFQGAEVLAIVRAFKSDVAIDDLLLFQGFAGVKPHGS
jgi:hypothetical protein